MSAAHVLRQIGERARETGHELAVSFVLDGSGSVRSLTWTEVEEGAWRARCAYKARGLEPGDRLVLAVPTSAEYLAALLGAWWAGLLPSTFHAVGGAATSAALESEWRDMLRELAPALVVGEALPDSVDVPTIAPGDLLRPAASLERDYSDLRRLSYIQFTSGSTGRPRGLALEWPGIRANLAAIARAGPIVKEDAVVSWLPMYHDMGLFGSLLTGLHVGCRGTYMDASLFARNPLLWLRLLEENRASIAVVPPSALQRCMDLMARRRSRPDFTPLRKILCGSEPISRRLIECFRDVMVPCGVSPAALRPVYGMAEATLAVTFPPAGREPRLDAVRRDRFETQGVAEPASDSEPTRHWVSVGMPLDGVQLRVVDDSGTPVPDRHVGEIQLQSPSLMVAVLHDGRLEPRREGWFDTGDLGYVADGEVYVTGRKKDVIIKYGRNHSPDRLEQLAALTEGVRRAVAFGFEDETTGTEKIVIVVETRAKELAGLSARDSLRLAIRGNLHAAGYVVDEIEIAERNQLPRTSSGKVRRQRCRELYMARELAVLR